MWEKCDEDMIRKMPSILTKYFSMVCEHFLVVASVIKDVLSVGLLVRTTSEMYSTLCRTCLRSGYINM